MVSVLRRAWASIEAHTTIVDLGTAALLLGAAFVSSHLLHVDAAAHDPSFNVPNRAGLAIGLACTVLPLALRRRAPLAALTACTFGFLLSRSAFGADETAIVSIVLSLAVYSAAANGRPYWRTWVCGGCLVAVMTQVWHEATAGIPADMPTMLPVAFLTLVLLYFALYC